MHVAVFGGTGFVGAYLIDALIASGHEPSVLVRPGSENKLDDAGQCRTISGDLNANDAIAATIDGCNAIIYSVGILREHRRLGITFENLQYDSVVRVADAAKDQGVARFLLMSANGVKSPGTKYQDTKYRAEQHIKASAFDFTVFRPSVIFGDPHGKLEIATQLMNDMIAPPIPAVGFYKGFSSSRGAVLMSPVHVEDVALAFVRALEDPATFGRTYALGGPETLSWTEMLGRVASAVGKKKCILPVPIGVMMPAAMLFDRWPMFPVTRDQLAMLAEGNVCDSAELASLIGKAPRRFDSGNLAYLKS